MKQKSILVLLLSVAVLGWISPAQAADDRSDFFGIKKFVQKGASANSAKKKIKASPAGTSAKENDSELTDEERKMLKEIADKAPKGKDGASDAAKGSVKVPPSAAALIPPKSPVTVTTAPPAPPKNPNSFIIRVPQPPSRVPQNPNAPGANEPPAVPGTKK